ncbi:MAG: MBL fold metallo-hydrolase [Aggregatilineales bacterium]
MAFEAVPLRPNVYHLQSGANSGLILSGAEAIVIDAGLDDDAGKRIKKTLEAHNARLAALILTHGHADHFGGAAYLRRTLPPFAVYAPSIEAAFIATPQLEGIMLSAGAWPFDALTGKFTLAQACAVDQVIALDTDTLNVGGIELKLVDLRGHSPGQIGVLYSNVLFCADAFLPVATLAKYPIPFTVHIGKALEVLTRLRALAEDGIVFAPGHGMHLATPADVHAVIDANSGALHTLIDTVSAVLQAAPSDEATVTQRAGQQLGDKLATPVGYYLARAAIQAALVYLYEHKRAVIASDGENRIVWRWLI